MVGTGSGTKQALEQTGPRGVPGTFQHRWEGHACRVCQFQGEYAPNQDLKWKYSSPKRQRLRRERSGLQGRGWCWSPLK